MEENTPPPPMHLLTTKSAGHSDVNRRLTHHGSIQRTATVTTCEKLMTESLSFERLNCRENRRVKLEHNGNEGLYKVKTRCDVVWPIQHEHQGNTLSESASHHGNMARYSLNWRSDCSIGELPSKTASNVFTFDRQFE